MNSNPFFKEDKSVKDIISKVKNTSKLKEKFFLNEFTFGKNLQILDSLSFSDTETNIADAIIGVNELYKESRS